MNTGKKRERENYLWEQRVWCLSKESGLGWWICKETDGTQCLMLCNHIPHLGGLLILPRVGWTKHIRFSLGLIFTLEETWREQMSLETWERTQRAHVHALYVAGFNSWYQMVFWLLSRVTLSSTKLLPQNPNKENLFRYFYSAVQNQSKKP